MQTIINVSNLTKYYASQPVLKGISFQVTKGEIFALLGTNGAGKTTTLECLEGIKSYDTGDITINGKMGVQLQSTSLPDGIKVSEALTLFAHWNHTVPDSDLITRLGLTALSKKNYSSLSTGQKRRLHLALAMTGDPDIIFLDEPTAGLDVEGRVSLHHEIRKLKQSGKTIIMATHDMAEVEALCDRLAILKDGSLAFVGTACELTNQMNATYTLHLKLSQDFIPPSLTFSSYKHTQQPYHTFDCHQIDEALLELLTLTKQHQITVHDLKIEQISLEDCFMDIAKEAI